MNQLIKRCILLITGSFLLCFSSSAQDISKEMAALAKKFESAYNKKDDKALKALYTDDATQTSSDGRVTAGSEAIVGEFRDFFTENKVSIVLEHGGAQTQADGTATTNGKYHITGTGKSGDQIDFRGTYTNTAVKVNGLWKISKSVIDNSN